MARARGWTAKKWRQIWLFLGMEGSSARIVIGLYMLVSGIARMWTGNTMAAVNVFSARAYGLLMALAALALLATARSAWRCAWLGRIAAIACAALWLLIIANAWPSGAWVSISGAFVFVLALGHEVAQHDC